MTSSAAHGGTVRLNSLVTSIDYEGNQPSGVTWEDSRGKERKQHAAIADQIVVNAALPNLAQSLLSKADGKKLSDSMKGNQDGASLLTVYYGFKKPLKEVGNKYYSTFIYDDSVKSQKDILENNHSDFSTRSFTFVDYSQVDSRLAPEGKSVGAVVASIIRQTGRIWNGKSIIA